MQHHWMTDRLIIAGAAIANGFAWAQSFASQNLSVGMIVTFCTVAVPAVCTATVYAIKNVGPVWLEFLIQRDKARSQSMAGQMERLNQNLENARLSEEATKRLGAITEARAVASEKHAETLSQRLAELTAQFKEMSDQLGRANKKLHEIRDAANTDRLKRVEAEEELAEIKARVEANSGAIQNISAKAEDASHKVEIIGHATEAFASQLSEATRKSVDITKPDAV